MVYGTSSLTMRAAKSEKKPVAKATGELEGSDGALFQRLRTLRGRIARIQGVPAYVVFSDKTLRELAVTRPRTMAQLRSISGVGIAKAERYGKQLLAEIESFEQ